MNVPGLHPEQSVRQLVHLGRSSAHPSMTLQACREFLLRVFPPVFQCLQPIIRVEENESKSTSGPHLTERLLSIRLCHLHTYKEWLWNQFLFHILLQRMD